MRRRDRFIAQILTAAICVDLRRLITVTCKLIDAVHVRTTEEAEPAAYGSIKGNQQRPSVVAGVNTAEPLTGPVAVLQPFKNPCTPYGATYGAVRDTHVTVTQHNHTIVPGNCYFMYIYWNIFINTSI